MHIYRRTDTQTKQEENKYQREIHAHTVSGVAGATSAEFLAAATAEAGAPVACTACAANERC